MDPGIMTVLELALLFFSGVIYLAWKEHKRRGLQIAEPPIWIRNSRQQRSPKKENTEPFEIRGGGKTSGGIFLTDLKVLRCTSTMIARSVTNVHAISAAAPKACLSKQTVDRNNEEEDQ